MSVLLNEGFNFLQYGIVFTLGTSSVSEFDLLSKVFRQQLAYSMHFILWDLVVNLINLTMSKLGTSIWFPLNCIGIWTLLFYLDHLY